MAAARCGVRLGRDPHPGIDGDDAVLIGEERVDVELANLRHVGGKLRQLDEHETDRALVGRRHVAVGLEDARHLRSRDQHLGELQIERRQRHRFVVDDLDRGAAASEHHHRAEGRIVGEPGDELARLGAAHHRLHR